jgi:hypothetical protein
MIPAPDNFDPLQRLLAWKRHEQPPPGYFVSFPDQVVGRIQDLHEAVPDPWWRRWLWERDHRPVLAGAYCVAVCGLLLSGISLSQIFGDKSANAQLVNDPLVGASLVPDMGTETAMPALVVPMVSSSYPAGGTILNHEPPAFLFAVPQAHARPIDFRVNGQ